MNTAWFSNLQRRLVAHWPAVVACALLLLAAAVALVAVPWQQQQLEDQRAAADAERRRVLARSKNAASGPAAETDPVARFVAGLPAPMQRQPRVAALLSLAEAHGLQLRRSEYRYASESSLRAARYRVSLPVSGSYAAVRRFIEAALQGDPALALDSLRIKRDNTQTATLQAELVFSFLMRAEPAATALGAPL
jgi:hypothetical protein